MGRPISVVMMGMLMLNNEVLGSIPAWAFLNLSYFIFFPTLKPWAYVVSIICTKRLSIFLLHVRYVLPEEYILY